MGRCVHVPVCFVNLAGSEVPRTVSWLLCLGIEKVGDITIGPILFTRFYNPEG